MMSLLEPTSGRTAVPQHGEVGEADPRGEAAEDELEVARRPEREDAGGDEVRLSVCPIEMPALQLLPNPRDDARRLLRED
eukprot:10341671-Alexandrium_andersonii.AAC.1